jgi:hypothetical protein
MSVNLTESNKDYAVFLPSISGFYQNFISKEMNGQGIPTDRVPAGFDKGVYGCNWLDAENSYYNYKWSLYSAGHAQLDTAKSVLSNLIGKTFTKLLTSLTMLVRQINFVRVCRTG